MTPDHLRGQVPAESSTRPPGYPQADLRDAPWLTRAPLLELDADDWLLAIDRPRRRRRRQYRSPSGAGRGVLPGRGARGSRDPLIRTDPDATCKGGWLLLTLADGLRQRGRRADGGDRSSL